MNLDRSDRTTQVRNVLLATPLDGLRVEPDGSLTGRPKACFSNAVALLESDPQLAGRLRWDQFTGAPQWRGDNGRWAPLSDADLDALAELFGAQYRVHFAHDVLARATRRAASLHPVHVVREYLGHLPGWDGVQRARHLFARYLGADDSALTSEMCWRWLISAVARVYQPGCKVDSMVVLVGGQAVGKSQFGRALAGEWLAETPFALGDKDAYLNLEGVWIYELAELSATRRSDVESVKAFISGRRDKLRRPYDRMPTTIERQCVFLGSTNEEQFLTDPTGNRRFWPVTCRATRDTTWARITELASVRDQVWAEVLTAYRAGERWILPERAEAELDEAHLEYQQQHPWKERVAEWLASPAGVMLARKGFLVTHVLDHLEVPMHQRARHHSVQVCEVLRGLGCDRRTVRDGAEVSKRWFLRSAEQ